MTLDKKSSDSKIASAIMECLISPNECDRNFESANLVDGLFYIGRGMHRIADALHALGNGNASTSMGAIEAASMKVGESISNGLSGIADAIRERDPAR